jgi:hypothetical protein
MGAGPVSPPMIDLASYRPRGDKRNTAFFEDCPASMPVGPIQGWSGWWARWQPS